MSAFRAVSTAARRLSSSRTSAATSRSIGNSLPPSERKSLYGSTSNRPVRSASYKRVGISVLHSESVCEQVRMAQSALGCFCRMIHDCSSPAIREEYNYEKHTVKCDAALSTVSEKLTVQAWPQHLRTACCHM